MTDLRKAAEMALKALVIAEAGLADIGDADREDGDDLAWCEARAAQALSEPRAAITALHQALAQPEQKLIGWKDGEPQYIAQPDLSIEANRVAYDVAMHYANKTKEKNT